MTCEDLIEWAEEMSPPKDFTDYRDLKELRDDLDKLPYGEGKRAENAKGLINDWFNKDLDVKGYNSTIDNIENNKIKDIREMSPSQAREEYETMKEDKLYSESTLGIVEGIVGEKIEPPIDKGKVVGDYRDIISSAATQEDLGKIVMGEIEREYGRDIRNQVSGLVALKGRELETLSERAFRETSIEIGRKTTKDELYDLSGGLTEIPNLTTEFRKELAVRIRERMKELESE